MKIKENVTNGIVTTILGCIIVVAAVTSVFVPDLGVDWSSAGIGMGVGIGLIGFGKK